MNHHFGDYQNAIYLAGLNGVLPKYPVDFATLKARAEAAMPPAILHYVQGGCGDEYTQDRNALAFHDWGMVPRMLAIRADAICRSSCSAASCLRRCS